METKPSDVDLPSTSNLNALKDQDSMESCPEWFRTEMMREPPPAENPTATAAVDTWVPADAGADDQLRPTRSPSPGGYNWEVADTAPR